MKFCPDCKKDLPESKFYRRSEHCTDCNQNYVKSVFESIRGHYQPEYPPHIQEYLDKRRSRLEAANG